MASLEAPVMPLKPIDEALCIENEYLTRLGAVVEEVEESHTPSPQHDERNREYLIGLAALGTIRLKTR